MFTEEGSTVPASPLTQPLPSHPHILQQLSESGPPPVTDHILKPDPARQPKPKPAALEAGLTLPSKASKRVPADEGVDTLGRRGTFIFQSVLYTRARPTWPHPPHPESPASARRPLASSGQVNEPQSRDTASPEAGKASGQVGPGPRRGPRERGEGSGRPGGGGDSCDPAPRSHLEHVAGIGGSGRVAAVSAPPTTERPLRWPDGARFLRAQAGRGAGGSGAANRILRGLSS